MVNMVQRCGKDPMQFGQHAQRNDLLRVESLTRQISAEIFGIGQREQPAFGCGHFKEKAERRCPQPQRAARTKSRACLSSPSQSAAAETVALRRQSLGLKPDSRASCSHNFFSASV